MKIIPTVLSLALLIASGPVLAHEAHNNPATEPDAGVTAGTTDEGTPATTDETTPATGHQMGGEGISLGNVTVSGVIETQFTTAVSGSLRQSAFANSTKNSDFVLTHVHPMIHAALGDKADASAMWCLTHVGTTALYEATVGYTPNDAVSFRMGRFLVPFGAWNPISNPSVYPSISRPLMYLGHEERNIVVNGGPRPIFNDEWSDIGLVASGQVPVGRALASWSAWGSNGIHDLYGDFPDAWIDFRPSEDNNSRKSFGGRAALSMCGATVGASWTGGKWDANNEHDYTIRGIDATWQAPSGLTLRAEYTENPVDRSEADGGGFTRRGWYGMAVYPVSGRWTAVALYSHLTERPAATVDKVSRATLGANYRLAENVTLKSEIGRLFIGDPSTPDPGTPDIDDVTTFKIATVVSF